MAIEELVLFPATAMRALKARNQQHPHAHGHEDGKNTSMRRNPMH
jgi:hypothetical protein